MVHRTQMAGLLEAIIMKLALSVIVVILLAAPVVAETSGSINISVPGSSSNESIATGFFAYTVGFCNTTSNCFGYACFLDYDGVSAGNNAGWCNASTITSCYHDGIATDDSNSVCVSNTTYRTCTGGVWGNVQSCPPSGTCSGGSCPVASVAAATPAPGAGGNAVQTTSSLAMTAPSDFSIVQGESAVAHVFLKNDGGGILTNISLSLSGVDGAWFSMNPTSITALTEGIERNFSVFFDIPGDAPVQVYTITVTATSSSAEASRTFSITVEPSETTLQQTILPRYASLVSDAANLTDEIATLESQGKNITGVKDKLDSILAKLQQINQSLESKNYPTAEGLMNDVETLLAELRSALSAAVEIKASETSVGVSVSQTVIFVAAVAILGGGAGYWFMTTQPSRRKNVSRHARHTHHEAKKEFFSFFQNLKEKKHDHT